MRSIAAFGTLFFSVAFVQLGVGVLGPLDALSGVQNGFTNREIGLLGSAHFLGFFVGCLTAPALMRRTGHVRAFAVVSCAGVVSALAHPIFADSALVWMLLRVAAGFAIAGAYTVIESWLQSRLENADRGRVLGDYRVVDMSAAVASQLLVSQLEPGLYVSYNIVAMVAAVSILPLLLTTSKPPPPPTTPRVRPWRAILLSPLGAFGVLVVGLTNSSFRMIGPLYGQVYGLSLLDIALFLAAGMLGGALAQPIAGRLSDAYDRRWVLIGVSAAALAVCAGLASGGFGDTPNAVILGAFLFGAAAMPLYSISAAHANDHCPKDFIVELNASLIFMFAVGAVVSPWIAAELVDAYGPDALWMYIGAAHVALIAFGFYRMGQRPSPDPATRKPYRGLLRSSLLLGRLVKSADEAKEP